MNSRIYNIASPNSLINENNSVFYEYIDKIDPNNEFRRRLKISI